MSNGKKPTDINDIEPGKRVLEEVDPFDNVISLSEEFKARNPDIEAMRQLNAKHIFVNSIGGKSAVTHMIYNEVTEREEMEFIPVETFKNMYMNNHIVFDKGRTIPKGHFWLQEPTRNSVDSVVFDPKRDEKIIEVGDKRYINLWEGFGTKAKKGNWGKIQRHIYHILCNSKHDRYEYVIKWLAWAVQNPDKPAEVALIFKGKKGTGKTFVFENFKRIFGRHGMVITDPNRLTGKFSGHFNGLCFLFCDEVYYPGNKEIEGRIKALITNTSIDIEKKRHEAVTMKNRLHIAMATNSDWVIPATKDERRYYIDEVNDRYAKGVCPDRLRQLYFNALWAEMDNGGREAMLHFLLNFNLKGWHPREDVPNTEELDRQKEMSLTSLQQALRVMLADAIFPGECVDTNYRVLSETICNFLEKIEPTCVKFSVVRKTAALKELGAIKERGTGGKIRWVFPDLKVMRTNWDKRFGRNVWDDATNWNVIRSEF